MEFVELSATYEHGYGVHGKHRYYYEKLCESHYGLANEIIDVFSEELNGIVDLSNYSDFDELLLLVNAGLLAKKRPESFIK